MMNIMSAIRPPAVANRFYPGEPVALKETVREFLREFSKNESAEKERDAPDSPSSTIPKAIIAPHAGFIYSGPTAGAAYGRLVPAHANIRRVVLLGPSHYIRFRGLATTSADFYHIPLGDISVDRTAIARLADLPQVVLLDEAHVSEHSLEVHLPFLREVLDDFMLVPLVVGETHPEEVAEVLERLWGNSDTLVVISTDLSHYLTYERAKQQDSITAHAIETLDTTAIHPEDACGRNPINGLLHFAKQQGMTVQRLDLRNSGDTAGDKKRVVGYGAWAFFEQKTTMKQTIQTETVDDSNIHLSSEERETLRQIAKDSIAHGLTHKKPSPIDPTAFSPSLRKKCATFVTLEKEGKLRGCIGSLQTTDSLVGNIAENAFKAAFHDPRFPLLTREEFEQVEIKLSLLTPAKAMHFESEADLLSQLRPGVDGLILTAGSRRATFLPSVWKSLHEPTEFLRHLKLKAGLSPDAWPTDITISRYTAEQIGE
uniref:MEMO1 family protein BECKTUN1418D_GA0071000_105413 n=1 Tax=Candidatus Kentrum sp. TUN TaxID=2126343 RepID=A0A450ZSV4_9GAMM|nr:MAG: hypothetical protein BECKTUN1418F_GA0071002_106213 [Candidatus Kentron sp. TUN]VFK56869.1 MAG: hypothetical protein BECKTUN1418D_GA0071000_105413 [Candidatus Kentron sp. TUN]VFK60942.1 MAG: hypothetical protein BECKTUN1418E_GA0071001_106013 [Candidatus Kentron sp. TUN]